MAPGGRSRWARGTRRRGGETWGRPPIIGPGVPDAVEEGDQLYVNVDTGEVRNVRTGQSLHAEGFPEGSPPYEILRAGGLQPLLQKLLAEQGIKPPERSGAAGPRAQAT